MDNEGIEFTLDGWLTLGHDVGKDPSAGRDVKDRLQ